MKRKIIIIFSILTLNFIVMGLNISPEARAATYDIKIKENDSYIWEITELNLHNFKKVFDFEPNFEEGDQIKIKILKVLPISYGWSLTIEQWSYKSDFNKNGSVTYSSVYSSAAEFADNIFLPASASEYLLEAKKTLPSKYIVNGLTVTKRESDYTMIKEYTENGVLVSESYLDDDGIVCVKTEGTFRDIPMGIWEPLSFITLAITRVITCIIKKKKVSMVSY